MYNIHCIIYTVYIKNGCSFRLDIIRLPVQKNNVGHVQFGKVEAMIARPVPGFENQSFICEMAWWIFTMAGWRMA